MKRNKGIQLGAVLAAFLIVSMAFVPAVSAASVTESAPADDVQVVKKDSPKKIEVK